MGFPGSSAVKNPTSANVGDMGSVPGSGSFWRRKWQLIPGFLLGEFLAGYSPWAHRVEHD